MALQHDSLWLDRQAQITLSRLLPLLDTIIDDADERQVFIARLQSHFPRLFSILYTLYGVHYDFYYHLQQTILTAAEHFNSRPTDLKALDVQREDDHAWFRSEKMIGATLYVDLFAGDFAGLREKIPYLQELGVTYLHLMPLFRAPADNSDGGYAVSSYRHTNPAFGDMDDLHDLTAEFREAGISLCLDFIFNHTSNEHTWALRARAGEQRYRDYYRIFPDRTMPDQYEENLREIFPQQDPGNFTWNSEVNGWVWTTFYHFQWDLNYDNPEVFTAMMGEMLFLANVGVEVLRLDAVAFVWKRLGTTCENLAEAHMIIRALNALVQIAAPALVFKSEAIVHPDDVSRYIDWQECPISYNPTLMAMIWDALATRRVEPLRYAMSFRYDMPLDCAWVNYVRVHDDIGWSFADDDMSRFLINGYDHRLFLNKFYTGDFPGSFANGVGFNYNPVNQDMRICGTAASLAGLEQAIETEDTTLYRRAVDRHLMIHSIILAVGGIPLLYIGDELATLNDYSYEQDPAKANDSRWVHRPTFDWDRAAERDKPATPQGEVFTRLAQMIAARKSLPAMGTTATTFIETGNPHVLGVLRGSTVLCLFNFSDDPQTLPIASLDKHWRVPKRAVNTITRDKVVLTESLVLQPLAALWLADVNHLKG